jgi:excisionase family DNA binding protein
MQSITAQTFRTKTRPAAGLLKVLDTASKGRPTLVWGDQKIELPEEIIPLLAAALQALSRGQGVSLITRPELLTTHEAAEMIACSRQHVVDLINSGKLKASKIGTHRRIRLDDLLAFIEAEDKERDVAMASLVAHTEEMGGYDLK